jgi:hypothetical protein
MYLSLLLSDRVIYIVAHLDRDYEERYSGKNRGGLYHPGRKMLMIATTIPARPIRIPATYHRWREIDAM